MATASGRLGQERRQPGARAMQGQGRRRVVPAGGRRGRHLSRRHPVHRLGKYLTVLSYVHTPFKGVIITKLVPRIWSFKFIIQSFRRPRWSNGFHRGHWMRRYQVRFLDGPIWETNQIVIIRPNLDTFDTDLTENI